MELLITIAYVFLIRLIFFDFALLKYNLFWKFVTIGLWCAAALTEIILLGQFTPYSKEAFVQSYVVQMAPEYGGLVKEVHVSPNLPVKKGEPLFQMDPETWQNRVAELEAGLAAADTGVAELIQQLDETKARVARTEADLGIERVKLRQFAEAAAKSAVSKIRLEQVEQSVASLEAQLEGDRAAQRAAQIALDSEVGDEHTAVAEALAELATAKYNVEQTTIRAPSDGYVANLQLYPGSFIRLKTPVMTFVDSEERWIVAKYIQRGIQWVRPGDQAEIAFDMYPGRVFPAEVVSVVWANGNSQGIPGGLLPKEQQVAGGFEFVVRLRMKEQDPDYPLRFGARGLVAIHTGKAADFLVLLRQIEIRSESYLNYLFNPF